MRRTFLIAALSALVAAAVLLPAGGSAAPPDKGPLCHLKSDGSYKLLSLPIHAVANHIAAGHGDGTPGDPVPGMSGFTFDENCVPVETISETIFAVAYTDIDTADGGYNAAVDVLIAKLVDANDSGVPDAGDEVITHQYPKDFDFDAAGFGDFGITTHTVLFAAATFPTDCFVAVEGAFSRPLNWHASPLVESYQELQIVTFGRDTRFADALSSGVGANADLIRTDPGTASAPADDLLLSITMVGDDPFVDVEVSCF